ncbi:GNAT family N-acetyltransferase [Paraoerskovia marina]|uniref:GNAT family N-acetyltransferase n=1 Tax=Paraoerskovia marina TaxID=545619 RepID=UPI0004924413|nr:GNAT family N-acetyltransferase [Paraoerskovia marina]
MSVTRLLTVDDAGELADVLAANREHLAPWDPIRDESFYTPAGQVAALLPLLESHARGESLPLAIVDDDGSIAGRITLAGIVRGPFLSGGIGYWVRHESGGRGLAKAAVGDLLALAFGELGLHRVQAETLLHNERSQRVLKANGFRQYGVAPEYLHIAGRWQDHAMFQVLAPGR